MNNELKVNLENLTEQEREQLLTLMEKANKPVNSKWFVPEEDENYHFVSNGFLESFSNCFDDTDNRIFESRQVFKTEEEAKQDLKRLQAELKYIRFLRENEPSDWSPKFNRIQDNWYLIYDVGTGTIKMNSLRFNWEMPLRFYSDKVTIQKAMNTPEILEAWKVMMGIG